MKTQLRQAPKGKFRVVGSDAHSMWPEGDFKNPINALRHAKKKVMEANGYDSMSVYNDRAKRIYATGLSGSVERSCF